MLVSQKLKEYYGYGYEICKISKLYTIGWLFNVRNLVYNRGYLHFLVWSVTRIVWVMDQLSDSNSYFDNKCVEPFVRRFDIRYQIIKSYSTMAILYFRFTKENVYLRYPVFLLTFWCSSHMTFWMESANPDPLISLFHRRTWTTWLFCWKYKLVVVGSGTTTCSCDFLCRRTDNWRFLVVLLCLLEPWTVGFSQRNKVVFVVRRIYPLLVTSFVGVKILKTVSLPSGLHENSTQLYLDL